MLTLTNAATDALLELLDDEQAKPGQAIRLVYSAEEGLSIAIDDLRPGDAVIRSGDRPVIFLDEVMAEALADETLDVYAGDDELQLIIK